MDDATIGDLKAENERLKQQNGKLRRLVPAPSGMGSYVGDTFYPVGGTEASHRWDGERWQWLPELTGAAQSQVSSLQQEIERLRKLAGDVRWKELGEGSPFTVIDRMMLRDMYAAAALKPQGHKQ